MGLGENPDSHEVTGKAKEYNLSRNEDEHGPTPDGFPQTGRNANTRSLDDEGIAKGGYCSSHGKSRREAPAAKKGDHESSYRFEENEVERPQPRKNSDRINASESQNPKNSSPKLSQRSSQPALSPLILHLLGVRYT